MGIPPMIFHGRLARATAIRPHGAEGRHLRYPRGSPLGNMQPGATGRRPILLRLKCSRTEGESLAFKSARCIVESGVECMEKVLGHYEN